MKESDFIEQNKEKWKDLERNLLKKTSTPQEVSRLFVEITNDLSYARTFYPKRSVKIYLNGIAKLLFNDIDKARKTSWSSFVDFWKKDLPLSIYSARRPLLISFIVFWCSFVLGVITSIHDPNFSETILSKGYVQATHRNIEEGKPMHVYADQKEMETFLPILANNLRVDFNTFFWGVFASIGSFLVLVYNGVMVGVFQFLFVEQDVLGEMIKNKGVFTGLISYFFLENTLFRKSFLAIWTHGTIEISTIILAGGAGITLGKGILFPGTYSRFQAFKISARTGLKVIMGVIPFTILAAFIEGFLTRHTDIHDLLRLAFILLSLFLMLVYFFWYPRKVYKKYGSTDISPDYRPVFSKTQPFNKNQIQSIAQIFSETLRVFFKNFGYNSFILVGLSLVFSIVVATDKMELFYIQDSYNVNYNFLDYFQFNDLPLLAAVSSVLFVIIIATSNLHTFYKLENSLANKLNLKAVFSPTIIISSLVVVCLFNGLITTGNVLFISLAFLTLPVLLFLSCISTRENRHFFSSMNQLGRLLNRNWLKFFLLTMAFSFICLLFFVSCYTVLNSFIIEKGIFWSLTNDPFIVNSISLIISSFLVSLVFLTNLTLLVNCYHVLYFSLKESYSAKDLLERIQTI